MPLSSTSLMSFKRLASGPAPYVILQHQSGMTTRPRDDVKHLQDEGRVGWNVAREAATTGMNELALHSVPGNEIKDWAQNHGARDLARIGKCSDRRSRVGKRSETTLDSHERKRSQGSEHCHARNRPSYVQLLYVPSAVAVVTRMVVSKRHGGDGGRWEEKGNDQRRISLAPRDPRRTVKWSEWPSRRGSC